MVKKANGIKGCFPRQDYKYDNENHYCTIIIIFTHEYYHKFLCMLTRVR